MADNSSSKRSIPERLAAFGLSGWLMVAVTLLGLGLRIEHAVTFDGPLRGADYAVHMQGVRWMLEHMRPFDFTPSVSIQIRYQAPLWYMLGAQILDFTGAERPIAAVAVVGWLVRQLLLAKLLTEAIPKHRYATLLALTLNAVLPLSVLTDGKLNPEGLHSSLFMVAVYALWRMEREAGRLQGISWGSSIFFGIAAGLAMLAKPTGFILLLVGGLVLLWRGWRMAKEVGLSAVRRRLLAPAVVAGLTWSVVGGWWCASNMTKFHHPFPHYWNAASKIPGDRYYLPDPVLYRRPLGWLLPFEWKEYLEFPVIHSWTEPRPNFWAASITGTWTDFYNRGFCRLKSEDMTDWVWGARDRGLYGGPSWRMSYRCVHLFVKMMWVGLLITLGSVYSVFHTAWNHLRTDFRSGSLVLPIAIVLNVCFVCSFAFMFPFDDNAVLNPRYLLPGAAPMAACVAIALGQATLSRYVRAALYVLSFLAVGIVGALLLYERFGV